MKILGIQSCKNRVQKSLSFFLATRKAGNFFFKGWRESENPREWGRGRRREKLFRRLHPARPAPRWMWSWLTAGCGVGSPVRHRTGRGMDVGFVLGQDLTTLSMTWAEVKSWTLAYLMEPPTHPRNAGNSNRGCGRRSSSHPPPHANPWKLTVYLTRKKKYCRCDYGKRPWLGRRACIIQVGPI